MARVVAHNPGLVLQWEAIFPNPAAASQHLGQPVIPALLGWVCGGEDATAHAGRRAIAAKDRKGLPLVDLLNLVDGNDCRFHCIPLARLAHEREVDRAGRSRLGGPAPALAGRLPVAVFRVWVRLGVVLFALINQAAGHFQLHIGLGKDHRLTPGRVAVLRLQRQHLQCECLAGAIPAAEHNEVGARLDSGPLLGG